MLHDSMNDGRTSVHDFAEEKLESALNRGYTEAECITTIEPNGASILTLSHTITVECVDSTDDSRVYTSTISVINAAESTSHKIAQGGFVLVGAVSLGAAFSALASKADKSKK